MTTHELLTSLLWLVAGGYGVYVAWLISRSIRRHRAMRRHPSTRDASVTEPLHDS